MKKCILIMLHCEQNTGYAIAPLENTFREAALLAGYSNDNILWSYSKVLVANPKIFEIGYHSEGGAKQLEAINRDYPIDTIIAFDLPYPSTVCKEARSLGINNVISYWGASMSSLNTGLKLLLKKAEWYLRSNNAPTKFIFESKAMQLTATHGRGVPKRYTDLIPLGVDTSSYYPDKKCHYAHEAFNIPNGRKIIFYSGHMEERKGVRVLIEAMNTLYELKKIEPFHLIICGNKGNESLPLEAIIMNSHVASHITFAGYRNDIALLMRSSFVGTIASTGWDSFTMSSVEMLSSGLPLIVSELQGLKETIIEGKCGEYIAPGDHEGLAFQIIKYSEETERYNEHSEFARSRAIKLFSKENQVKLISKHFDSGNSNRVPNPNSDFNINSASKDR